MKRNFIKWGTMFTLLPFLLLLPVFAEAETEDVNVKPNEYQEKNVKINTDYLHEDSFYQQRDQLSEDQLLLKFEGEKTYQSTLLANELFKDSNQEKNTIQAKSEQLNITFDQKQKADVQETLAQNDGNQSILIIGLFTGLIVAGVGALFFLIPKITQ
jgi:type VII secretion protein EssA